nr:2-oxoglutarate dehydrogenase E1 component [Parachlamydiaceae bacterium]
SIEGAETLIPMMGAIIDKGAELGVSEFFLGMAHRGRLNVLTNILEKPYAVIFAEFDENHRPDSIEQSGDVKYHKGFFSDTISTHGHKILVTLTPNPSHLEAVDPVVEGQAYARQKILGEKGKQLVLPILIHGDAALAGQGIVYETMQMGGLEGYGTGGTLHLVINNQIGFTTLPKDSRSTLYCTDIAKAFDAPVFHVNAEDPENCVRAVHLAIEIRQKFGCDVFVDLICYRKYGHNETDEPAFTQPKKYQIISNKKSIREIYREQLIGQGILEKNIAENLEAEFRNSLQEDLKGIAVNDKKMLENELPDVLPEKFSFHHIQTGVQLGILQEIAEKFSTIPDGFSLHPKLERIVKERLTMIKGPEPLKPIDWGMAETLAYGSLLWEGVNVRLSGQDSCRGTFSHRHAMWMDQKNETPYYPLKNLKQGQGSFEVYNSLLSEFGVLGFELGYSLARPDALVIWEAQFGDFCNGAQVIIDQFISTGEQKWSQQFGLVMLLPHGYEGQGPEHSSGRMERFLTLAGQSNLCIANPSTPAQLFHLLRRQQMQKVKKPLVVFTPKALLRHPECVSHPQDLSMGSFQEILDDPSPPDVVRRIAICSGHIYYDLIAEKHKGASDDLAILRVEQLYPFNAEKMKELLNKHQTLESVCWIQEEPGNMGAGQSICQELSGLLPKDVTFRYIARPRSASPAVGSYVMHKKQLKDLLASLFGEHKPSIFDIAAKKK